MQKGRPGVGESVGPTRLAGTPATPRTPMPTLPSPGPVVCLHGQDSPTSEPFKPSPVQFTKTPHPEGWPSWVPLVLGWGDRVPTPETHCLVFSCLGSSHGLEMGLQALPASSPILPSSVWCPSMLCWLPLVTRDATAP